MVKYIRIVAVPKICCAISFSQRLTWLMASWKQTSAALSRFPWKLGTVAVWRQQQWRRHRSIHKMMLAYIYINMPYRWQWFFGSGWTAAAVAAAATAAARQSELLPPKRLRFNTKQQKKGGLVFSQFFRSTCKHASDTHTWQFSRRRFVFSTPRFGKLDLSDPFEFLRDS